MKYLVDKFKNWEEFIYTDFTLWRYFLHYYFQYTNFVRWCKQNAVQEIREPARLNGNK